MNIFSQRNNKETPKETTITINGVAKTYTGDISIIDGNILVNGKPAEDFNEANITEKKNITIYVVGNVENIVKAENVHITGDVKGNVNDALTVTIQNTCYGNIDNLGSVTVNGNCYGKIDNLGVVNVTNNNQK